MSIDLRRRGVNLILSQYLHWIDSFKDINAFDNSLS